MLKDNYKSIKTYQKIKEIAPSVPDIELGTYEEIELRFLDLCSKYSEHTFPEDHVNDMMRGSKQRSNYQKKLSSENLQGLIDTQFKQ